MNDRHERRALRRGLAAACAAVSTLLSACGGGGGGGGAALPAAVSTPQAPVTSPGTTDGLHPLTAAKLAGLCAAPRYGIDPDTGAAFPDRSGSLATEKAWVRAWIDETYLWYSEVPPYAAGDYATPVAYFNVLKTPLATASGRAKDRFHFTADTASYQALSLQSVEIGYGFEAALLSAAPPRDIRIAYTELGSPAAQASLARGMQLLEIDGIDVANGSNVDGLNAGLAPQRAGEVHSFKLQSSDGSQQVVSLAAARITRTPVQNVKTIDTGNGRVGYLLFNDHIASAESALVAAVNQLQAASVGDLVIDMRYNGGGLLDIASELAYMVGPAAASPASTFERLLFNAKNPFGLSAGQSTLPFRATAGGYSVPAGQQLPKLGLSRVTVLTGPDTCSASESVVNGLRGVGVTVNLVGGTTCGKPYGFYPQDNCGTTYFAIQFQGVNQQGFGDYGDGFAPTCAVADDFGHALGDPAEARLAAALGLRSSGACPVTASALKAEQPRSDKAASAASTDASTETVYLVRSPLRENRLLAPPAQP